MPIRFRHGDESCALAPGQRFERATPHSFADTSVHQLNAIVAEIRSGRPWQGVVTDQLRSDQAWLAKIVLSPLRPQFFAHVVPPQPGLALDIGCGWGQTVRPLAAAGWRVAALEPGSARLDFVEASSRQDGVADQISFIAADYLETHFETRFDLALCIGVFEWIGAFQEATDPLARQRAFLRKVRSELARDGALVIGIENRLGLKYLFGCPDDHIGEPGVAFLPAELASRRYHDQFGHTLRSFTYTDAELTALLHDAGFTEIEFFAALPDYKLPEAIVPLIDGGAAYNAGMLSGTLFRPEHNGYNGAALSIPEQENLQATYASMAMQGIAHHFAPSFFVRAR